MRFPKLGDELLALISGWALGVHALTIGCAYDSRIQLGTGGDLLPHFDRRSVVRTPGAGCAKLMRTIVASLDQRARQIRRSARNAKAARTSGEEADVLAGAAKDGVETVDGPAAEEVAPKPPALLHVTSPARWQSGPQAAPALLAEAGACSE